MSGAALVRSREFRNALLLALLAFALYAATLCRTVYWYDSAEYVTAAVTLGVPHPPGYPLYTLLAHAFTWLPLSPALAVNAMSAVFAALAIALSYACARELGARATAAAAAAALLASVPSFWLNATIAEVYAPGLCCALSVLWLLARARAQSRPRLSLLAAALAGAGLGIHYSIASLGVGFVVLALWPALAGEGSRMRRLVAAVGKHTAAVALGYALAFAYVFARAGSEVIPNQAYPPSAARFAWLLAGGNYRLWFHHDALGQHALHSLRLLEGECSLVGLALAVLGLGALFLRDRLSAVALLSCIAGNLGFFFRYRVDDLEVFLLPSVALVCISAALGVDAVARRVSRAWLSATAPVVLTLFAAIRILEGYARHDLSDFTAAYDYGARLATELPSRAVILNYTTPEEWKYHAVFGMYFQNVLGVRRDVIVVDNADRPLLDRLLFEGRPTFLYAPVAHVVREYTAVPEGELYRLVRRR